MVVFKKHWRKMLTGAKPVQGIWRQIDATTACDSVLGTCRLDSDDQLSFYATIEPFGEIRVSLVSGHDKHADYTYARSVLVHLPILDAKYRSFAAADVYELHQLLGPEQKLPRRALANSLKLSWIQLIDPCSDGGTVWYSAGSQLGGARVAVRLDTNRRYAGAGFG